MSRIPIREAERRLEELAEDAARGEEVVIVRGDGAAFRLVPALAETPRPRFGSARGQVVMAEDFDAPLDDFEAYLP